MTNQPPPEQALQLFGAIHASPRDRPILRCAGAVVSPGELF
jgi:hypothetical protein